MNRTSGPAPTVSGPDARHMMRCVSCFLHHVLDEWFENEVRPRMAGPCSLLRFADDVVMTFKNRHDAKRVLEVLGKRLERYGLALHTDKTRFIDFRPERQGGTPPDCQEPPFDFLGFTHTWAKSQTPGRNHRKARTWCGSERPKAGSPARWSPSTTGAGETGISRCAPSTPGCLRSSRATTPITASLGTFSRWAGTSGGARESGESGWHDGRARSRSPGTASARSKIGYFGRSRRT